MTAFRNTKLPKVPIARPNLDDCSAEIDSMRANRRGGPLATAGTRGAPTIGESMKRESLSFGRRRFLMGLSVATIGMFARSTTRAQTDATARIEVAFDDAGRPIAADFIGLSYETAILAGADYFTPDNESVLGLIRLLSPNGVIRIGGNTSERSVWGGDAKERTPNKFVITPKNIDRLAAALRALGWRLIYGLNLARGTPREAAEEAAYVSRAVRA